jgi:hypothetical protein
MAKQLSENSRHGFEPQKPLCIGPETCVGDTAMFTTKRQWGLAVYVRNDPVNLLDRVFIWPGLANRG